MWTQAGALVVLVACVSKADTVELKTGERIEGIFKQAIAAGVTIEVGGQSLAFPLDKVHAIYFGQAPTAPDAGRDKRSAAIDAIRGIRSLTVGAGVSLRDYTSHLTDTRITVGRYLDSSQVGPEKTAISATMKLYEFAARIWTDDILNSTRVFMEISNDASLTSCPTIQKASQEMDAKALARTGKHLPEQQRISSIGISQPGPQLLWKCAEEMIDSVSK